MGRFYYDVLVVFAPVVEGGQGAARHRRFSRLSGPVAVRHDTHPHLCSPHPQLVPYSELQHQYLCYFRNRILQTETHDSRLY